MKKISPLVAASRSSRTFVAACLAASALMTSAQANTFTWVPNTASQNWSNPTSWSASTTGTIPNAVGDVANMNADLGGSLGSNQGVVVSAPITIGTLNIGDATAGSGFQYLITATGTGKFTMNNGGAGSSINESATSAGDTITIPIVLADSSLNNSITSSGTNNFTVSGGISGTGNLILQANATGTITLGGAAAVNNAGSITNSGAGAGPVIISAGIGSNVTAVNENSATSTLSITGGAITVNSAGTTLNNNSSAKVLTVTSGVTGTGTLVLNNNSATASGITISGTGASAINNSGPVVNSGTGAGSVTISSTIGASVTGLTQNSSTSALTVSGTNTYTGTTFVQAGTLNFTNNNSLGASTSDILLGDTAGSAGTSLIENTASVSWSRNVTVQSGNTGTATIGQGAAGTNTVSGNITLGTGTSGHGVTLSALASGVENFSGNIVDGGSVTSNKGAVTISTTGGTVELSGTNTFGGGVNLTSGNLSLNSATALGTGTFTINGGNIAQVTSSNSITNTNAEIWDQDFSASGVGTTLSLGNGAINLGALTNNILGGTTAASSTRTVTVSGTTTLTVGGTISNGTNGLTNSITKLGAGTLILSGNNLSTGGSTINAGVLQLGGTQSGSITINSGGSLNAAGLFSTVAGWLGSGLITSASSGDIALTGNSSANINFSGYSNLMLGASVNSTYTGTITPSGAIIRLGGGGATLTLSNTNAVSGANNLVVGAVSISGTNSNAAVGTVQFTGANNLTGTTTVNAGTLNLATTTGALGTSDIIVNGSTLAIDNGGGATPSGTYTRAKSITLNGATLTVSGTGVGNSNDAVTNALTLGSGYNTITANPVATTKNTAFTAGSLVDGTNAYGFVNGVNLGKAVVASNSGGGNIFFNTPPTLTGTGTTSGGLNTSQYNTGILPYLVGEVTTTTGTGSGSVTGTPNTFVTYDTTTGLRPLSTGEYATSITGTAGVNNVRLLATSTGTSVASSTSINSLLMSGTVTVGIADGATLTNNSGAILFTANGGAINATGATASGALAFGSAQGIITVNSGLADSISAVITGSNGIAKLGAGTLTLSGTNSYTGGTQILAGQLNLSGFTNPASTGTIFVGATSGSSNASLNLNTATASTVTNNIVVQGGNYGTAMIAGGSGISQTDTYSGSITLGSNGIGHNVTLGQLGGGGFNSTTFSGNIADPVGLTGTAGVVTVNGNTIRVSGNNSYSGGQFSSLA